MISAFGTPSCYINGREEGISELVLMRVPVHTKIMLSYKATPQLGALWVAHCTKSKLIPFCHVVHVPASRLLACSAGQLSGNAGSSVPVFPIFTA